MSLLRELGYERVRPYSGGMEEWTATGGPLERVTSTARAATPARRRHHRLYSSGGAIVRVIDAIASRSVGQILAFWLGMVLAFGLVYWIADAITERALLQGGTRVPASLEGLATAIYFSFTTATSVGYGDVIPVGFLRVIAVLEATAGLLVFGFIISKFLGHRQENLVEEIHRISFEDRLDRVQSSLHFILAELQSLADGCADPAKAPPRTLARFESAVMVFAGELRTIHDLLYRPQQAPEEQVLEGILANLKSAFQELLELVRCLGAGARSSAILGRNLALISMLASEICGECVPRQYAPDLKALMDEVQALARKIEK